MSLGCSEGVEQEAVCCNLLTRYSILSRRAGHRIRKTMTGNMRTVMFNKQCLCYLTEPRNYAMYTNQTTPFDPLTQSCSVRRECCTYIHLQAEIRSADNYQAHRPPSNGIDRQLPHSVGALSICQDSETPRCWRNPGG